MDLADQVDGYICTFEGQGDLAMDALYMWIFVLVLLVVAVLALINWRRSKKISDLAGTTDKKIDASAIKDLGAVASSLKIPAGLSKEAPAGFKSGAVGGLKAATSDSNLFKGGPSGGLKAGPGPAAIRKRLTRKSPGPEIQRRDKRRFLFKLLFPSYLTNLIHFVIEKTRLCKKIPLYEKAKEL